jgi:hypothetical protein
MRYCKKRPKLSAPASSSFRRRQSDGSESGTAHDVDKWVSPNAVEPDSSESEGAARYAHASVYRPTPLYVQSKG